MSHFAELDKDNIVKQVLVGNNDFPNEGYDWFLENLGGRWIQTSFNGNFRKNFAHIGFTYDEELDAFIPPTPFESWVLNEETCQWDAPTPCPEDDKMYIWNEETTNWEEVEINE